MKVLLPVLIGIAIRVLIPFKAVWNPVRFASPDSYYYARLIRDGGIEPGQYYPQLMRVITAGLPFNDEKELLVIPLVFVALTIVSVYMVGRMMAGPQAGFWAALIFAVFPGEYLGRSLMGNIDHHYLEVYFTTSAVLCLFLWLSAEERSLKLYGMGGMFLSLGIYSMIWHGYLLFYAVFAMFWVIKSWQQYGNLWVRAGLAVATGYGLFLLMRAVLSFSPDTWQNTSEALPLLGISPPLFTVLLVFIAFFLLGAAAYDYYYFRDDRLLFVVLWLAVMIVATFMMRRFAYYLVVPTALLLGYVIIDWVQNPRIRITAAVVTVLLFGILSIYGFRSVPVPSDDWMDALQWLKQNTPEESTVTAGWDYGYWIEYEAERRTVANPSQDAIGVKQIAGIMTVEWVWQTLQHTEYLVLDEESLTGKYAAIEKWAGRSGENAAVKRIWAGETDLIPIYGNNTVKIYKGWR